MKTLYKISVIASAVLALAGCTKEKDFTPLSPDNKGEKVIITASRESNSTKTILDGTHILWSPQDAISVFYGGGKGEYGGSYFESLNEEPQAVAEFEGLLQLITGGQEGSNVSSKAMWGIYPYSGENTCSGKSVNLRLPDTQTVPAFTFDPHAFPAIASANSLDLAFYNICGLLKVNLGVEGIARIEFMGNADEPLSGMISASFNDEHRPVMEFLPEDETQQKAISIKPVQDCFETSVDYYIALPPTEFANGVTFNLYNIYDDLVASASTGKTLKVERNTIHEVKTPLKGKELKLTTICFKQSGDAAWNAYYGGTPGTDRNIAMDDEYVYIAENSGTAKLWALSIADPTSVKQVNVEGVSGGTHLLACPRVLKNTNQEINGGKDILICSNLTRGGEDPKLYMWLNGIDSAPRALTLQTWATGAWYGDVFTVYGSLQSGVLFFDKIGGDANGVVTFLLQGLPSKDVLNLWSRIKFNDVLGSHNGACAYYPLPDDAQRGIYSPGRGTEARGKMVSIANDVTSAGAHEPVLSNLDYAEGRNGFVLGYNFIEWSGKRYVIYGKQPGSASGSIYVIEGAADADWLDIASTAGVKYRRDLVAEDGSGFTSGNSGMDVTARVINGDLYFAGQKQNVCFGLYKLSWEY